MRKDPDGGESWRKEKDCPLENAFWTAGTESSKAPLSSVLSPLITFDQPPPPIGARPMPPSRAAPKEGLSEKQTLNDNTNTRSDSGSGSSSGALGSTPSSDSTRANERPAALPGYQSAFMSTFAAPNERPAGQSEYRSAFLSTLAHRNEKQAVAPQVQNSFVHTPARPDERPASKPRIENYPFPNAFVTPSRPPSPPGRALPGIPAIPFTSKTSALPTAATRLGASNMNRQASYTAVLGPFVGAPNATARIERVLDEAVGPGGNWRARAWTPGLGLLGRQNQARGGVLRAVLPLDRDEEEEEEEEEEDGRGESEEDGAGDGAHDNTAPASAPARDRSRPWVRRRHPARGAEDDRDAEDAENGTAPAPAPGPGPPPPPPPPTGTGDSAPPPYERPDVLLEEFCRYYGVNATDQERLARLEFEPGDEIDSLPENDWKGAGFTTLGWRRIVTKNNAFIADSRSGLWG